MKQFEVCLDIFENGKWHYTEEYDGTQFDTIDAAKQFMVSMKWLLNENERYIIYDFVNDEFTYAIEKDTEIYLAKRKGV